MKALVCKTVTESAFCFTCSPGRADSEHFQNSWASVWVKMATVWLCFGVYVWTLVAPLVLGNCRDFDYADN